MGLCNIIIYIYITIPFIRATNAITVPTLDRYFGKTTQSWPLLVPSHRPPNILYHMDPNTRTDEEHHK